MSSILLVEDNDDHAVLAQAALSSSDQIFEVDRAASADECLAMLGKKNYDAIVLDYSLPRKSGLDILQDIEKIPYNAPVVMITSHGDEQVAVEAMKRGAYDYVSNRMTIWLNYPWCSRKLLRHMKWSGSELNYKPK